ncbi:MAG: DNA gyrase inhibitor YacG [Pseudomonadota bacterium]
MPKIQKACPLCGKPAVYEVRPFCSTRCQSRDLLSWARGGYVLPGDAPLEGIGGVDDDMD